MTLQRKERRIGNVEVSTDGRTVWVNHDNVGAIGRFSTVGIDIHNDENNACEDCGPHKGTPGQSWAHFQLGIMERHGVMVPDDFKPAWVT